MPEGRPGGTIEIGCGMKNETEKERTLSLSKIYTITLINFTIGTKFYYMDKEKAHLPRAL